MGSVFPERHREPVRQSARCHRCKREAAGTTRFESMTFGQHAIGRPIHFCDECMDALILSERPLKAVLRDLAADCLPPQ